MVVAFPKSRWCFLAPSYSNLRVGMVGRITMGCGLGLKSYLIYTVYPNFQSMLGEITRWGFGRMLSWGIVLCLANMYASLYWLSSFHNKPIASFVNSNSVSSFSTSWGFSSSTQSQRGWSEGHMFLKIDGFRFIENVEDIGRWVWGPPRCFPVNPFESFFPNDHSSSFPWFKLHFIWRFKFFFMVGWVSFTLVIFYQNASQTYVCLEISGFRADADLKTWITLSPSMLFLPMLGKHDI